MAYVQEIIEKVEKNNPGETEFHNAVKEVLYSIEPVIEAHEDEYRRNRILERLVEPERTISFRVPWVDDNRHLKMLLQDRQSAAERVVRILIQKANPTER